MVKYILSFHNSTPATDFIAYQDQTGWKTQPPNSAGLLWIILLHWQKNKHSCLNWTELKPYIIVSMLHMQKGQNSWVHWSETWQVVDTSKAHDTTTILWYKWLSCPLAMGQSTTKCIWICSFRNYKYYYNIDNCHRMTSKLMKCNTCLLVIEGAIIFVKHLG